MPHSVVMHITSRNETDLLKAVEIADVYSLIHRPDPVGERKAESIVKSGAGAVNNGKSVVRSNKFSPVCSFCKKPGHLMRLP